MIFGFFEFFLRIFNFLFLCIKQSNYLLFKRGLRLFKGLCLLFLPNVPGATFIQGGTFIPDSRVFVITASYGFLNNLDMMDFEYLGNMFGKILECDDNEMIFI